MPELHSKLAVALAEALIPDDYITAKETKNAASATVAVAVLRRDTAITIDKRLAEIRKHYEPEELERCPVVSHHGSTRPCAFCITSAMRAFILIPTE